MKKSFTRSRADAKEIAEALGGQERGGNFMCFCPVHDDTTRSLSVKQGRGGKVLVYCFAGCGFEEVKESLERLGLDI